MFERDLISLYLDDIRKYEILEKEEEAELLSKAKIGDDEAKNKLILSNLKLVVNIAKNYNSRNMSLIDLISEGNFGLMHAIEKFDISKGNRFSTYAVWWIKQSISKALISKGREIRIPSYKHDMLSKINRYINEKTIEKGGQPSSDEIALILDLSPDKVDKIMLEFQEVLSLNAAIGEDIYLEDTITENEVGTLEDQIIERLNNVQLRYIVESLDKRERDIVKLRFGLDDNKIHTLEEIGKILNLTRERVRQIEKRALEKLKIKCSDVVI